MIEIVSRGSEGTDQVTKVAEYAAAGIPRYWMVARDTANTVTFFRLGANGRYETSAQVPLAWLLQTSPHDHLPEVALRDQDRSTTASSSGSVTGRSQTNPRQT